MKQQWSPRNTTERAGAAVCAPRLLKWYIYAQRALIWLLSMAARARCSSGLVSPTLIVELFFFRLRVLYIL
jgi:hypothetical protein